MMILLVLPTTIIRGNTPLSIVEWAGVRFLKAFAYLKQATGKECEFEVLEYIPDTEEIQKRMATSGFESDNIELLLYPNPASNQINISAYIPEDFSNPELYVYDLSGRKREDILLQPLLNRIELNTSSYTSGIYILQIKTQQHIKTLRFSIQN
jgi:hypothetical protein